MCTYRVWNNALWNYFFPNGDEDAILYLDDDVLRIVATKAGFNVERPQNDFLRQTLINDKDHVQNIRDVVYNSGTWIGPRNGILNRRNTWDTLVLDLKDIRCTLDGKPPYFAMLCAIMYIASTQGADHNNITTFAKQYLGEGYRGKKPGELVDVLMQKLHEDKKTFNPDRMAYGRQRQMSRIKYHLVLKSKERQDFVDFLEVGNLQWNEGSYADYANNILIPALHRADKPQRYFEIVEKQEYIPYVKNILLSNLNWGKSPEESVCGNIRPIKDIKWKYEMELDYNSNPIFYISTDFDLPFGVKLNANHFEKTDEIPDYIASEVQFQELDSEKLEKDEFIYNLSNIAQDKQGVWKNEVYFQRVGNRYYHQVEELLEGNCYVKLKKSTTHNNNRHTDNWENSIIELNGYEVYETTSYVPQTRQSIKKEEHKVKDVFGLCGAGSWFGINLQDDQNIFWYPDRVQSLNEDDDELKLILAPNGKTYFRLPRTSATYIRGNLMVKDNKGNELLSEQIKVDYQWNGSNMKYGYNEWGEAVENGSIIHINISTKAKIHIVSEDTPLSDNPNMLIQILYDYADENGCVSQQNLKDALNFVMGFYDIVPTPDNRRSLIYTLRRLGYIVAYRDGRNFINQLVAPYLEKTNYSFDNVNNVYLIKGIYSCEALNEISDNEKVRYKRPYSGENLTYHPEYKCLPDFLLFQLEDDSTEWRVVDHPVAYDFLAAITDMKAFEDHFQIKQDGDIYMNPTNVEVPYMIKNDGEEKLCVKNNRGNYVIRKTYCGEDHVYRPIPKHLSRVYCQNKKNQPIALLGSYKSEGEYRINSSVLTILSGMGKPALLDMALCDLNLGIPETSRFFVMDDNMADILNTKKSVYSLGDIYNIANSVDEVSKGLKKLSTGNINFDDLSNASAVFVYSYPIHYHMKLVDPKAKKLSVALYYGNESAPEAFSIGANVYQKTPDGKYREMVGDNSVNEKISSIINNTARQNGGSLFDGDLSFLNNTESKKIYIIKKNTIKCLSMNNYFQRIR